MFLPLFVTQALQKCCRGGVGWVGREVKAGREGRSPGGFPSPLQSPIFMGTLRGPHLLQGCKPAPGVHPSHMLQRRGHGARRRTARAVGVSRPPEYPTLPSLFRRGH